MAEKKMTQVQALEIAVAEVANEEAREVLKSMVEKRKAPRKPRVNKAAIEFAETVFNCLDGAEGPITNGEIAAALNAAAGLELGEDGTKPEGWVSIQKVAAAIRRLKSENRVEEFPGEKAKDKKTYAVMD